MIRLRVGLGGVLALLALTRLSFAQARDWPREPPPPPLAAHHATFPPYQLKTLANGLRVLVVLQHEQPSVSFRLLVKAGAMQEPADRPGLANFVASLLSQGTATRSAQQIATAIDSAGGLIDVGSGNELTFVTGAVIKDQTDLALGLAADLVQHPAFSPDEITLHRSQVLSSMQVSYDDPDYVASLVFDRLVFGTHPYGQPSEGSAPSLARVTRDDLVAFHRTWFVPNNSLLAIVGDLTSDEAFAAAERAFGGWVRRDVPVANVPSPPAPSERVVVIDRPGSAQTEIRVGHIAITRTDPDFLAFDLAIRILGGEGANRLFGVLRSERGLTYGAQASLRTFLTAGQVVAETNTRSEGTAEALRLVVDEFARLQREPVQATELSGAQDFIAGNFPLSIESSSAIAEQVLARLVYGQDLSDITTYPDRVARITPDDIQRVAKQYLKPDRLSVVLVGDAAKFVDQLAAVGFPTIERIPLAEFDIDSPTLRRTPAPAGRGSTGR